MKLSVRPSTSQGGGRRFNYDILVARQPQPQLADATAFRYRVVEVRNRERVPASTTFRLAVNLDGTALIEQRDGKCVLLGTIIIDTSEQSCEQLQRRDAVSFQHHATEPMLVPAMNP
jgi:hypothetical protein